LSKFFSRSGVGYEVG